MLGCQFPAGALTGRESTFDPAYPRRRPRPRDANAHHPPVRREDGAAFAHRASKSSPLSIPNQVQDNSTPAVERAYPSKRLSFVSPSHAQKAHHDIPHTQDERDARGPDVAGQGAMARGSLEAPSETSIPPPTFHSRAQKSPFDVDTSKLTRVAGVDVSYRREFIYNSTHHQETAVACLAVLAYPSMAAQWVDFEEFVVEVPYVPGFLAFRESPALKRLIARCPPRFTPGRRVGGWERGVTPGRVRSGVPPRRRVRGSDGGVSRRTCTVSTGSTLKEVRMMCDEAVRTSSKEGDGVGALGVSLAGGRTRWRSWVTPGRRTEPPCLATCTRATAPGIPCLSAAGTGRLWIWRSS